MGQVTAAGYIPKTLTQITTELSELWRGIYGENISLGADTPDGQLVGMLSQIFVDYEELGAAIYKQLDPRNASGRWLDQRLGYASLVRRQGAASILRSVLVTGVANVVVKAGFQALDANRVRWISTNDIVLDANGQGYMQLNSEQLGSYTLPIGSALTPIAVDQVTTLTTTQLVEPGSAREQDPSARNRILNRQIRVNSDNAYRIAEAISKVPGITAVTVYENPDDVNDSRGSPPHSIWCIVDGGTTTDIALAILSSKTGGAKLRGAVRAVVKDQQGIPREVGFDRSLPVNLQANLTIALAEGATAVDIDSIKASLTSLRFTGGQDVAVTRLYSEVNKVPGFWVRSFTIGPVGGTMVSDLITVPDGSVAQFSLVNVTIS